MYTVAGQEVTSILLQLTYTQNSKMGTIPSRYMLKSIPPNDAKLYSQEPQKSKNVLHCQEKINVNSIQYT